MSNSVLQDAISQLESHGLDVSEPRETSIREEMDPNDIAEFGSFGEGVSSARYNVIDDSIDLFLPLAKAGAVSGALTEEQYSEIIELAESGESRELFEAFQDSFSNIDSYQSIVEEFGGEASINSQAEIVAQEAGIYDALSQGLETEETGEETVKDMKQKAREKLQLSAEHELVHKQGMDAFISDEELERIDEIFDNMKELAAIREEALLNPDSFDRKRANDIYQMMEDSFPANRDEIFMAAAMELSDGYEQKKQEVLEDLEVIETEMERTTDLYGEAKETWDSILSTARKDVLSEEEILSDWRDFRRDRTSAGALEDNGKLEREDYREFLERHDLYTEENLQRLEDGRNARNQIEDRKSEERSHLHRAEREAYSELENYLAKESERLEDEIMDYLEPVFDRGGEAMQIPLGSVGESFAHFWTMYRKGDLENQESRERKKQGLKDNYPEGDRAAEVIDELFQQYDSMEADPETRVTEIMQQQPEYLEREMEREPGMLEKLKDTLPGTDYLPY
ncbi:MAG: hypothetical protein ABEK10_00280 [Candidatus Nanosalina sp.]